MRRAKWLIGIGLLAGLMVLPPIPGYLIAQLEMAAGSIQPGPETGMGEMVLNPLRLIGALVAGAWVWAMAYLHPGVNGYLRYLGTFVGAGILYVLPVWLGAFGSNLGWAELWWLLGTASWYEWMQLHAPVAGALSMGAMHLLRDRPEPEPRGVFRRLALRLGNGRDR